MFPSTFESRIDYFECFTTEIKKCSGVRYSFFPSLLSSSRILFKYCWHAISSSRKINAIFFCLVLNFNCKKFYFVSFFVVSRMFSLLQMFFFEYRYILHTFHVESVCMGAQLLTVIVKDMTRYRIFSNFYSSDNSCWSHMGSVSVACKNAQVCVMALMDDFSNILSWRNVIQNRITTAKHLHRSCADDDINLIRTLHLLALVQCLRRFFMHA